MGFLILGYGIWDMGFEMWDLRCGISGLCLLS
jgi:hypothetical protein